MHTNCLSGGNKHNCVISNFLGKNILHVKILKHVFGKSFFPPGTLTLRITLLFVLQLFFDFHLLGCLLCVQRKCLESFWVGSWTKPCLTCLWSLARPWRLLSKSKSSWTSLVRRTCCRTSMMVCGHNICFPLHRTSRGYCWLLNSSSCLCCVN